MFKFNNSEPNWYYFDDDVILLTMFLNICGLGMFCLSNPVHVGNDI